MLPQDASFKVPKGKNWHKRYVELELSVSIAELEKMAKDHDLSRGAAIRTLVREGLKARGYVADYERDN